MDPIMKKKVAAAVVGAAQALMHVYHCYHAIIDEEDDSSSSNDELPLPSMRKRKRTSAKMPRVRNYMEIIAIYTDGEFQFYFRLSRDAFEWLLKKIGPALSTGQYGRPTIDIQTQLLSVLWILATPDSFRSVASHFGMSKGSLHACFYRVVGALATISPSVGSWPDPEERKRIRTYFKEYAGIDGVVGIVDATYVPTKAPQENMSSYVNQKCFYGITLQGICDDRRRFLDAFIGYPSSTPDIQIFQNSDIYKEFQRQPDQYFAPHEFLLADKAYETKTFCVPPYKHGCNYTPWQRDFNRAHSRIRQVIERTFALFFGRFRRFKYLNMSRTDWIPTTIMVGVVLHNVCLMRQSDTMQALFEAEGIQYLQQQSKDNPPPQYDEPEHSHSNLDGRLFRDELVREMGLLDIYPAMLHNGQPKEQDDNLIDQDTQLDCQRCNTL